MGLGSIASTSTPEGSACLPRELEYLCLTRLVAVSQEAALSLRDLSS